MGLKHRVHQQKLRRFVQKLRGLQEDLFAVSKLLMGGCKEQGAQLPSEVCGDRTRCNRHEFQVGKFQLDVGKAFLLWMSSEGGGCPEHLGHLHLGNVHNLAGHGPEHRI